MHVHPDPGSCTCRSRHVRSVRIPHPHAPELCQEGTGLHHAMLGTPYMHDAGLIMELMATACLLVGSASSAALSSFEGVGEQ